MELTDDELEFLDEYVLSDSMYWIINKELYGKLTRISNRYRNEIHRKWKLGECYVPYLLTQQFRDKGLNYSRKTEPLSYRCRQQYPRYNDIDLYVRIVDENLNVYRIYLNIFNWMKMHNINDVIFNSRITRTFERLDPYNSNIHVITMNHRNIKLIKDRCEKENILIIPMREHITKEFLGEIKDDIK